MEKEKLEMLVELLAEYAEYTHTNKQVTKVFQGFVQRDLDELIREVEEKIKADVETSEIYEEGDQDSE